MSAGAEPETALPGISATKTSLVEVVSSNTPRSPPPPRGHGGVSSAPEETPSQASGTALLLDRRWCPQAGSSPRAATAPLYLPRPPSTPKQRRTLEYVRVSKSELNDREQATALLRSENVNLQATLRELRNLQDSHSALQSAVSDLGQCLGCSVEGVAADSVRHILHSQATNLLQDREHAQQRLRSSLGELERSKGEAAAIGVQVSSLETQLQQARAALTSRDSEILRLQAEVERLRGSEARNDTALQSLRQRLTEMEGARGEEDTQRKVLQLHTETGRLKKALQEKEESQQGVQSQLEASQAEVEEMGQRVANLEEMYEDLCSQLAGSLQLEEPLSHNMDTLITEVGRLALECPQLRLRTDTLAKTLKTCELDSRASRETILRLVSEVKKHEKLAAQLSELQQAKVEQEALLESLERERDGYQERLVAAKRTMEAQETELQAKEARISELVSFWHSLKATADAESELTASEQQKFRELCRAVGSLVGSSSNDSVALLQTLEQVVQKGHQLRQELEDRETEKVERGRTHSSLQTQLAQVERELKRERERVKQLEEEQETQTLAREGLERDTEREQQFHQRLASALKLDNSATAQVLTGDFTRDAILVRAEQMAKHETQALAEKQSAFYSAQRQLKTCRQSLESKEMYLGLLQKKASSLEERLQAMSQRETHLQSLAGKSKRLEKQVERLRVKVTQQTQEVDRLQAENKEMVSLKTRCAEQEMELGRLSARLRELSQAKAEQARQLAEARARAQSSATVVARERKEERKEEREGEGRKRELKQLQEQLGRTRDVEQKFTTFQEAIQRLLSDSRSGDGDGGAPSNYNLIARLELLVAEHKELRETVRCLGSSLQQLEQGFRNGYSDTMAILQTKA